MSASRKSKLRVGVPVLDRISEAVRNGDEEKFGELISLFQLYEGANLNQLDSRGSHPLHEAVTFRRQRMLQTLLHYRNVLKLDVNITNMRGETALDIAVRNKNSQALKKLLKYDCRAETLEELREQLDRARHCPFSSSQRDVEASCRSEIMVHHNYRPTTTKRSTRRHLLHPISGTHWSDEICEKAVRKCYHSLSKYMDSVYIVPLLVKAGHLSPEQVSQILSCQTKTERALQLLALLHGSGKTAYQGLFKALKEETEHEPHQELLQELERTCESLVTSGYESAGLGQSQEFLDKVTTIYHGDDLGTPVLDRSFELSDRTESGIYSATPTAMQGTHSSGRMSTPRRTSSQGSRKKSTSEKNPNVSFMKGKVNRKACANFRAPDERQPRPSLHVIDVVVKRDPAPVQATATDSNANSGTCLVTGTGGLTPLHTQALLHSIPNPLDSVSFFVESSELEEEDITEKDASVEVPAVSSPKGSAPIDIPLRNESCATPTRSSAQDSASVSSRDGRSPRVALMTRQSSTDTTTSSDTSSSDGSYIKLNSIPAPKDLSHITPLANRHWWKNPFAGLVSRLSSTLSGTETIPTTSTSRSGNGGPSYVMGCGMRM